MYPVFVDKEFAESVLRSIGADQPIAPRGQWNVRDMVFVAGALRFAAMSHGPVHFVDDGGKPRLATVEESQGLSDEYQEALEDRFADDLSLAIEVASSMALAVKAGTYDDEFEPHCIAIVGTEDGKKTVQFLEGHRAADDQDDEPNNDWRATDERR
jgi:hypothetical protein